MAAIRSGERFVRPGEEIREGERLKDDPVTGETFRVTAWVERDDRIIAVEKEPADE